MSLEGGAAYYLLTTVEDSENIYKANYAHKGGAIYSQYSTLTVSGSTFDSNVASEGGAIYAQASSYLYIKSASYFNGNGAVY